MFRHPAANPFDADLYDHEPTPNEVRLRDENRALRELVGDLRRDKYALQEHVARLEREKAQLQEIDAKRKARKPRRRSRLRPADGD